MLPTMFRQQRRSAVLMLALLLAALWLSAAHIHTDEDRHPPAACAVCVQLQSLEFAGGNSHEFTVPLLAFTAKAPALTKNLPAGRHSHYHTRAPPALLS